jgi:hypothetical protein
MAPPKRISRALSYLMLSCLVMGLGMLITLDQGWLGIDYLDTPIYRRMLCEIPLPAGATYKACGKPYSSLAIFCWKSSYYITSPEGSALEELFTTELPSLGWHFLGKEKEPHIESTAWLLCTKQQRHWLTERQYLLMIDIPIPSVSRECHRCYFDILLSDDAAALRRVYLPHSHSE